MIKQAFQDLLRKLPTYVLLALAIFTLSSTGRRALGDRVFLLVLWGAAASWLAFRVGVWGKLAALRLPRGKEGALAAGFVGLGLALRLTWLMFVPPVQFSDFDLPSDG